MIPWDGRDNAGAMIPPGTYDCNVTLTVGELHFVATDVETSYQGLRMFSVQLTLARFGLDMLWNDAAVQANAVLMLNGQHGLERAPPGGFLSGDYLDTAEANTNARAWGDFSGAGKGNGALLDTYTWVEEDTSGIFSVTVMDSALDTDGDALTDYEETCVTGTNPSDPNDPGSTTGTTGTTSTTGTAGTTDTADTGTTGSAETGSTDDTGVSTSRGGGTTSSTSSPTTTESGSGSSSSDTTSATASTSGGQPGTGSSATDGQPQDRSSDGCGCRSNDQGSTPWWLGGLVLVATSRRRLSTHGHKGRRVFTSLGPLRPDRV